MDGKVVTGAPEDLVLDGTFESVFERDSFEFDRSTGSFTLHHPQKKPIHLTGDTVGVFWTRRALEREGHRVTETNGTDVQIDVQSSNSDFVWSICNGESEVSCTSISEMLDQLKKA